MMDAITSQIKKPQTEFVSAKVFWVLQTEQTLLLDNRPHIEQLFTSIGVDKERKVFEIFIIEL